MSIASQIAWDDTILPFQLDRADVRGRVARLDSVLETILDQHAYPAPVAALIAEAVLLTALIGQTIKMRWRLSLQVRGQGAVRLIATDYFGPSEEGEPARMRAAPEASSVTRSATPSPVRSGDTRTSERLSQPFLPTTVRCWNDVSPPVGITRPRPSAARRTTRSGYGDASRLFWGFGSDTAMAVTTGVTGAACAAYCRMSGSWA